MMATTHILRKHPSSEHLEKKAQLARKLAEVASDTTLATSEVKRSYGKPRHRGCFRCRDAF